MSSRIPAEVPLYSVRKTVGGIVIAVIILVVAMWAAIAAFVVAQRQHAIDDARLQTRNLAISFREDVASVLREADGDMNLIAEGMRRQRGNFDLYAWGKTSMLVSLGLERAVIVGADGKLKSATFEPHPSPVDLSDRDYFRVRPGAKSANLHLGLYFGQTVIGRLARKPVMPIARHIYAADGTFLGIIVVLIPPDVLTNLNKSIDLGPHGVMSMIGLDRRIRARFSADSPDGTKGIGASLAAQPIPATLGHDAIGSYTHPGVLDGITRVYAYSRVGSYPLIVIVGLDLDRQLAAWRSSTTMIILLRLFATLLLAGLGAYLIREFRIRAAHQAQSTYSAEHDFLTGLPNRTLLNDRLNQVIALARRHKNQVAVLFLDLDGFKHVNDSLGHRIGDRLLQSIALRLAACIRGSDTISRQGGDEFVALLSDIERPEDAAVTARRMLRSVAAAHAIDQHDLHITTSIGVSVYPEDGLDADALIKHADAAMYQAKAQGRDSYQFFTPAMSVRAVERQAIEEGLRRALERHEFALHYQPKIDLKTGAITGAEALLRWTHPTRGSVPPATFIPIAEDCGLILPIGAWVLRAACRQAQAWAAAGLPPATMAVNVSAMEFQDKMFLENLLAILRESGLEPGFLEVELTESVLMKHAETAASTLHRLRESGVKVAIDDFGTGYSSLGYLRKFPLDVLKIDQSFVRQISTAGEDTAIVTAVIVMAHSLKLRVVAEGVEQPEELAFLRAHKCDEAQGYYFSRPVPAAVFARLLATGITEPPVRILPAPVLS